MLTICNTTDTIRYGRLHNVYNYQHTWVTVYIKYLNDQVYSAHLKVGLPSEVGVFASDSIFEIGAI